MFAAIGRIAHWLPSGVFLLALVVCGLQFGFCLVPCAQAAPSVAPVAGSESYARKMTPSATARPALLQGLMAPDPRANQALKTRLDALFPKPIKEASLTEALIRQGFTVSADKDEAHFSEALYPCLYQWRITWEEDAQHNVLRINGRTRSSCT